MWLKNANIVTVAMPWIDAVNYCNALDSCGYNDWRLPSVVQSGDVAEIDTLGRKDGDPWGLWEGIVGAPFVNVQSNYWSSTTYVADTGQAWYVNIVGGGVYYFNKGLNRFIWPVRGTHI